MCFSRRHPTNITKWILQGFAERGSRNHFGIDLLWPFLRNKNMPTIFSYVFRRTVCLFRPFVQAGTTNYWLFTTNYCYYYYCYTAGNTTITITTSGTNYARPTSLSIPPPPPPNETKVMLPKYAKCPPNHKTDNYTKSWHHCHGPSIILQRPTKATTQAHKLPIQCAPNYTRECSTWNFSQHCV